MNGGDRLAKITEADRGRLIREASKGLTGSSGIGKALQLPTRGRRFRPVLQDANYFTYKRMMQTLSMGEYHEKINISC